jgi:putative transcriptional regulator
MSARIVPLSLVLSVLITAFAWVAPAHAADVAEETVILVAKRDMSDPLYGSTVLIAKHLGNDFHLGFIINRPTSIRLSEAFPEHGPSQSVRDPIYLGGPFNTEKIFTLVKRIDSPGGHSFQVTRDLFLAFDAATVDQIIEVESDHARFFVGLVAWEPGELGDELKRGLWYVLKPEADFVLRKSSESLWEELVTKCERFSNAI